MSARIHPAWGVASLTLGALVAAAAFRSSTGILIEPLEAEFGWDRTTTSGAVSLNLIVYGLTAPFAAAIMERFGVRRVVALALAVVGVSSALTTVMTQAWQLWLLWGLCIGVGTGAMALVFGAIVANRWFSTNRGLVTGIFSAANATGQLIFLPVIAQAATLWGWRSAVAVVSVLALALVPLVLRRLYDSPAEAGVRPYGAGADEPTVIADAAAPVSPARLALSTLAMAARRWPFWALAITFWICGWSTNGLIQTHFVPAAHDHGMPATTAAGLLALVGVFDIVGTIASGWLTDRVDPRALLCAYYALRGVSLLFVQSLLGPSVAPPLWFFIVFYGLDWVATVPPTVALCRQHFGLARSGVVFGWVFAAHMVGAGVGAAAAGVIRQSQGDYHPAWLTAGLLCLGAAVIAVTIRRPRVSEPARVSAAGT